MSAQLLMILALLIFRPGAATAEAPETPSKTADKTATKEKKSAQSNPGKSYVDEDRDGRNDHFLDADGDGKNDIGGKPYPHRFRFIDKDGDGKNDIFRDQDGDGVNDLSGAFVDLDGDGIPDNIIDHDRDGKNDITGLEYSRDSLRGYRYGRVDEERTKVHRKFLDRDADGMHDLIKPAHLRALKRDIFIDEDGDGISDGRRLRLRERTKSRLSKHLKEQKKESPKRPPKRRPIPKREKSRGED